MKKITALILAVATILTLASCSFLGGKSDDYNADPKTFEFKGLKITLTEDFRTVSLTEDEANYISTNDTDITVLRMPFAEYGDELIYTSTRDYAYSYADELDTMLGVFDYRVRQVDGIWATEAKMQVLGIEFVTLSFFFKGNDAAWSVMCMCEEEDYDVYEEHFIKWAKTVTVS